MIYNEGLYTALTWSQLLIGLIFGLVAVFATNAMEWMRHNRQVQKGGSQSQMAHRKPESELRRDDEGTRNLIVSIMRAAYYTLGVLAAAGKPVFLGSIVRRVHATQKANRDRELLTPVAIRASLDRLVSHHNVRLGRRGISITDSGVELFARLARINERPAPEREQRTSLKSSTIQAVELDNVDSEPVTAING